MRRALASLALASTALAQPQTVVYQGFLTDLGFQPVDGTVTLYFKLYTTPTGGTPVWLETVPDVPVAGGFFSVDLGLGPSDLTQSDLYLTLAVDVQTDEMTPRQPIASAPWALLCADATRVAGVDAASVQRRVTGSCAGGTMVRAINSDGSVDCETDDSGGGAVTSVSGGLGLLAMGAASVTVDVNAGSGIVAQADDVALDFTGSTGLAPAAARADHGHFQYVPAAGTKTCDPGDLMYEIDPSGSVFCGPDRFSSRFPGPSGNLLLTADDDFQLNPNLFLTSLTASGYFLPAPRSYQLPVPASAFRSKQPNTGNYYAYMAGYITCDACEDEVLAALYFPEGAQITGVDIVYANGAAFGQIQCWLHVIELATRAATSYDLGVAPAGLPGIQTYSVTIGPPPVTNRTHAYVAECYLYSDVAFDTTLYAFRARYDLVELVR